MTNTAKVPPQYKPEETRFIWIFTGKQTLILGAGAGIAGGTAIYLPLTLSITARAVLGLSIFLVFAIGGFAKIHGTPALVYFGSVLGYKLTPRKYTKVTAEKSAVPPTQNWLGFKEVKEDIVVGKPSRSEALYFTMLKVRPIDLMLRTEEAKDLVYARMATAYDTFDFPLQIIVVPIPYNTEPYITRWEEKITQYDPDSFEAENIRLHIEAFKTSIEEQGIFTCEFYVVIPARMSEIAPGIIKKENADIRAERSSQKKKELRERYAAKKYEKAAEDLRTKKSIVINALQNIDPDLKAVELIGEKLEEALVQCYGGLKNGRAD